MVFFAAAATLVCLAATRATPGVGASPQTQCAPAGAQPAATTPVAFWSTEARCAIVPPTAGPENFGNKFPGEAGVYMGIVHAAIYDAAVATEGGYRSYAITLNAPDASPEAAIATAAHHTLVGPPDIGLQPALGLTPAQQAILDGDYAAYMDAIPDSQAKISGIAVGAQVAAAILALRANDGREANPEFGKPPFVPPASGPGVWEPDPSRPVLGLRLPRMRPLALESPWQFRPDGPNPLTSEEYTEDFQQVKELGRADSSARTAEQTAQALFWTDHDARQWNDGMLGLAADQGLDLVQTARMLAMAHVAGADALIACFDAKYHYWFWRPYQAIARADTDGNPATEPDTSWRPLRTTPNHPEYPSAHACHSTAVAEALAAFFGTDNVPFTLDSRVTGTTRAYDRFQEAVKDVNQARVFAGFHFRNSDQEGSNLGRKVGRFVVGHFFQPLG
jgi:PAP2 superfamily